MWWRAQEWEAETGLSAFLDFDGPWDSIPPEPWDPAWGSSERS